MAITDNPAFTSVRQFLSAVCGHVVPHLRSAAEFCVAFPPELIMDRIEDVEVRANILYATAGRAWRWHAGHRKLLRVSS